MKKHIHYKKGYKYQIVEDYNDNVHVYPNEIVTSDYIILKPNGDILIKKGYCFDGPSGPTVDSKNFMRGSLVHDALYQLIREKKINKKWRKQADKEIKADCKDDGMSWFRRMYVFKALRKFGSFAANPKNARKIYTAPKVKSHDH